MKTTTYTNTEVYAEDDCDIVIGWNKIKTTTEVIGFTRRPEAEIEAERSLDKYHEAKRDVTASMNTLDAK